MPAPPADADAWDQRVRDALSRYAEPLLRRAAGSLFKIKIGQPADDLIDKSAETQTNAPVIDRRVRDLPDPARKLLALVGLSRQPRWKVGHLIGLSAAVGHADGFVPVRTLLDAGLLFPELRPAEPIADYDHWFGTVGLAAMVFAHPAVAARARGEPVLASGGRQPPGDAVGSPLQSDGLEWPLRLAAVWQQVRALPVRLTQANTLFKRDLSRLQGDPLLSAPFADVSAAVADGGLLAFDWATAAGLFADGPDGERHARPVPPGWDRPLWAVLADLFAAFFAVETWDPVRGYHLTENGLSPTPTAALLTVAFLADGAWHTPAGLAEWLWANHPSWSGSLPKDVQKTGGGPWVEAFLLGVAYPLRLVEAVQAGGWRFRLSEFGRHLLAGGPEPATPPGFPQTILVQPNAEVLAYRQGLTPGLVATLSRFATWKGVGPACTLELNADETYRGLEGGFTLADITRTLDRHGMRPVPANVADLLRRWADKRERITVYPSATLVEFATAADLDAAVARGVVSIRLTDRVGLTADGSDPPFAQLRLIGNRDYEARPQQCVTVAPDGVTLTVDAAAADLLLDAEIVRMAEPAASDNPTARRYLLTPESVRRAVGQGMSADDFDAWFTARTGKPLPPAARLFVAGPAVRPPTLERLLVVRVATPEVADGLVQWPTTAAFIEDRLGPTAVVVAEENLEAFRQAVREAGVDL
jgi:hypothetical protein